MRFRNSVMAGAAVAAFAFAAQAAENLTIGVALETPSIDPYFYTFKNSTQVTQQIFDPLIRQNATQQYYPSLALSWKAIDDKTWEFKLRPGVKWHDGSPFTADDVLYSVERAKGGIPGSATTPSRNFLTGNKEWKKIDDLTIHVVTPLPHATMVPDMSEVVILSRKNSAGKETKDYNAGPAAIGTGPFKFVEYVSGDRVVLAANPAYWGGKPAWDQVTMKNLPNNAARVSALLSGTVDVINDVPAEDIETVKKNPKFNVTISPSTLMLRLMFNYRDQIPGVNGPDGKPLAKNPFQDIRVRKALSLAVDRQRIADRIMAGTAVPASQPQPPGGHAFDTSLKPDPYDPDRAKALLAEAGYKDGFSVMVTAPDARWGNDKAITEAVVQMLNRIGIKAELDIVPNAVYPTRGQKGELSLFLGAWGTPSGDGGNFLTHGIHTFDEVAKLGAANWGRYSNKAVDDLIDKSNAEMDTVKREGLVRDAWRTATDDTANIWLLWVANTWASKADLVVDPRLDAFTMGTSISKKK